MSGFTFHPIARIESCYKEKFGIPRQARLAKSSVSKIIFPRTSENEAALRGLDSFSHIWVIFIFHAARKETQRPTVRPPRLSGKVRVGVYGTRSPHRPNSIGMSAVEIHGISVEKDQIILNVRGGDFLDGTPVLDIKPYLQYCDSIPESDSAWAGKPDSIKKVEFDPQAGEQCAFWESNGYTGLRTLISESLGLDPRPRSQIRKTGEVSYGCRFFDFNVRWVARSEAFRVVEIQKAAR